jgi:ABC-2 type transport system ATP-binding protein
MAAIETCKLTKAFGKFTAVDGLDLTIEDGQTYGLLGPNGSGKTTAIRMITGLLEPTSGTIKVLGKTMPSKEVLSSIGYMPQDVAVYVDNTVHENLELFGRLYGMPAEQFRKREEEMLRFVDLAGWKNALASTLSGGMRHRLSLACALLHEPKLLILDEPTVGVDPELRASFWEYFEKLGKKGITVVITTHYMDEAGHCQKVGLLRQGRLIAEGNPEELMKQHGKRTLEDVFLALARRDAK